RGSVSPVGVSVIAGAFLFGVGMQLGGGCASGTLYTSGGGNTRMLVTLAAFIAGSVVGVLHLPWWEKLPALKPISLIATLGVLPALAVSLALFAIIAGVTVVVERRRGGLVGVRSESAQSQPGVSSESTRSRLGVGSERGRSRPQLLRGPWPLAAGALGLAAVNIATLALAGRPWGVTSAF